MGLSDENPEVGNINAGADITLVTVTYNSAPDLKRFWMDSDRAAAEWIVVDNASSDGSADLAESMGATVIRLDRNVGFGAACNRGLRESNRPVVGFVNPDVAVDSGAFRDLAEVVRDGRVFAAPQLINEDGSLQPNGRGAPSLPNKIFNRLWGSVARRRGYQKVAVAGEDVTVDWLMGAAIFGSRERLDQLGGFDERFFVYYEDIDLCLRARQLGISCLVKGDRNWVHGWARAASGINIRGWRLEFSSARRFYMKYPSLTIRSALMPIAEKQQ